MESDLEHWTLHAKALEGELSSVAALKEQCRSTIAEVRLRNSKQAWCDFVSFQSKSQSEVNQQLQIKLSECEVRLNGLAVVEVRMLTSESDCEFDGLAANPE